MAKGLRASSKKSNKTKLRERVFGPVEAARLDRLSSKLLDIASKPGAKVADEESMEGVEKGWSSIVATTVKAVEIVSTHGVRHAELYSGKQGHFSWTPKFLQLKLQVTSVCTLLVRSRHYPLL